MSEPDRRRPASPSRHRGDRCGRPSPRRGRRPRRARPPVANARWPGEWPGTVSVSKAMPASSSVSSPASRTSGLHGRTPCAGEEVLRAFEDLRLDGRHVHRGAGALGEVGDAAEVVVVRVRDQDRRAARAAPCELESQLGRVAARIDDDGLGALVTGPDDVAVRPDRAELVAVDDGVIAGESSRRVTAPRLRSAVVQRWDLLEIDAPERHARSRSSSTRTTRPAPC